MGGDGRGDRSSSGGVGAGVSSVGLIAALSGPPGVESAWALAEGLESGAAAGWDVLERRVRVFAAQQRLAGWLTYGRLVEVARWLAAWRADPPISSGLPDEPEYVQEPAEPADPSDPVARAAMLDRLEGVADGYERRRYRLFGYPGTARQWAEELAEPLVASELAVAAGLAPTTARAWVRAAEALFIDGRLPGLARLLEAGWVDWAKAKLFVWETAHLDAAVARAVDAVVLGPVGDAGRLAGSTCWTCWPTRPRPAPACR